MASINQFGSNNQEIIENGDFGVKAGALGLAAVGDFPVGIFQLWTVFPEQPTRIFANLTGATSTIVLPQISTNGSSVLAAAGHLIVIKNVSIGASTLTIGTTGGDSIDTPTLIQGQFTALVATIDTSSLNPTWRTISNNTGSVTVSLQDAYDASINPEIMLSDTGGGGLADTTGFTISNSALSADKILFEIINFAGTSDFLTVRAVDADNAGISMLRAIDPTQSGTFALGEDANVTGAGSTLFTDSLAPVSVSDPAQFSTVFSNGTLFATGPNLPGTTNTSPNQLKRGATQNTTDATPVTLSVYTLPANSTVSVTITVNATRTGGTSGTTGDNWVYFINGRSKLVGGTITTTTLSVHCIEDAPGLVVQLQDNATDTIQLELTGLANNNITWNLIADLSVVTF